MMQTIIDIFREKLNGIDGTAYSGKYKEGYADALEDMIDIMEDHIFDILVVGNTYFVITYADNNRHLPQVEEMRLTKIRGNNRLTYCFIRDLDTKMFLMRKPDIELIGKSLIDRVFVTREAAEKKIQRMKL